MKIQFMYKPRRPFVTLIFGCSITLLLIVLLAMPSYGVTAKEIDSGVDIALKRFQKEVKGGKEFLQNAKGVLIFPKVIKAGLGIGGEYGEGALRINGRTVDYYSTAAGSIGIQLGGQTKIVIVCFMEDEALKNFRNSAGWKGGVDGSVAMVNLGAGKSVDTITIRDPIVGFVFGQQGLMFNATLEGAKFTKLVR